MILSIDPGISTGVAVLNSHGTLIHSTTFGPGELTKENLCGWGIITVIEDTPVPTLSKMNRQLGDVLSTLRHLFQRLFIFDLEFGRAIGRSIE